MTLDAPLRYALDHRAMPTITTEFTAVTRQGNRRRGTCNGLAAPEFGRY